MNRMSRRGRPPTTIAKLGLEEPLRTEFIDYLAAKDGTSIKIVVSRAIRQYMDADFKENPGFERRFNELQERRRKAQKNGLRIVQSDETC
jgi:hypothetical protein